MNLNQEFSIKEKFNSLSDKNKLGVIFSVIVLAGLLIGLLVCMFNTLTGKPIFPFGTFVFSVDRFVDYYILLKLAVLNSDIYSNISFGANYFPFTYLFLLPLSWINWDISFVCSMLVFVFFTFFYVKESFPSRAMGIFVALTVLVSYPFLFSYDRANVEIFLFIFLALFVLFYRKQWFVLSAIMLSVAISMKLYPAVLLVLFLSKKQFKLLFYTLIFSFVLTYLGYIYTGSNLEGIIKNIQYYDVFSQKYLLGLIFGHSLYNLVRVPLLFFTQVPDLSNFIVWVSYIQPLYAALMLLSFGFISAYLIFINKKFWKAVLILFLVLASFPYTSQDYTLAHLAIPLLLLFGEKYTRNTKLYVILMALLFIPMNWVTWAYPNAYLRVTALWCYPITPGLVLKPIIIIILLVLLIKEDFTWANLKKGIAEYFGRSAALKN